MNLNEQITQLRKERKMSQEELAERLQVSRQSVSKWENGLSNPDTENLIRLADIFQVDVNLLIGSQLEKMEEPTEPAPQTPPPDSQKKTIRLLSILLALSVCLCGVFAGLWLWERFGRQNPSVLEPNANTRWDSIEMYRYIGPIWEEVPLTDEEKAELADRLWNFHCVEKPQDDVEDEILYGGYRALIQFTRGDSLYSWCVMADEITYSVKTGEGRSYYYVYESDQSLLNWTKTFLE